MSLVLFLLQASCTDTKEKPPLVEESKRVSLNIKRFDKDLFSLSSSLRSSDIHKLKSEYPDFLPRFGQMLNIGKPEDSAFAVNLAHFISDPEVKKVYEETQVKYKDLSAVEKELSEAFTYYSHYFPQRKVPSAIAYVSGFNYAIAVGESFVAAGLDMYMGKDYRYYGLLQFPQFKIPFMDQPYIAPDMMRAWLATEFPNEEKSTELISAMIHEGKVLYAMRKLFPEHHDSLISGFNGKQLEWLERSEKNIWTFLIDRKMLFSTNFSENAKYLNEAPFSPGMPKESPGRTVVWVGYRIIDSYMKKFPKTTLNELFELKDSKMILNSSGYKPMK